MQALRKQGEQLKPYRHTGQVVFFSNCSACKVHNWSATLHALGAKQHSARMHTTAMFLLAFSNRLDWVVALNSQQCKLRWRRMTAEQAVCHAAQ